ncbi:MULTISPECIES: hypothetical protein [unclassified Streptococcus]|uniref:hypothetical protein n=1 Tax=unclassified Streptococcus TaxID=2608887 RepID=UPI001072A854|nr:MULTISPECIES: hypothetical protein [unclassified Streptococcus]MBF0806251.1 hypothetical protein [Streptococcus sp. 19428wA2_WM07]TFU28161.1 hypothetical protein E4T71_05510 [Streptococcus sp. WM07]
MAEIEKTIADYTQLKQLVNNELFTMSESLIKTLENSLVIAIYSLSEQLLKNTIYKILEVQFDIDQQTPKDRYILGQMPPERYPVTPTIERILAEMKFYYPKFELYTPSIVMNYKDSYVKLVKARHDYAHANNHTQNIDFDSAKKFVEYLNFQYNDINNGNYISKIKSLYNLLNKFVDKEHFRNFYPHYEAKSNEINELVNELDTLYNSDESYDIDYLNDIYEPLREGYTILLNITEESFSEDIEKFKNCIADI